LKEIGYFIFLFKNYLTYPETAIYIMAYDKFAQLPFNFSKEIGFKTLLILYIL